MTQAIATRSPIRALLSTVIPPLRRSSPVVKTALAESDRAELLRLEERIDTMLVSYASMDDREFTLGFDQAVVEPLRNMVRRIAGKVREPEHLAIVRAMEDGDSAVGSLHEHLIDRDDAEEMLEQLAVDLRYIARDGQAEPRFYR